MASVSNHFRDRLVAWDAEQQAKKNAGTNGSAMGADGVSFWMNTHTPTHTHTHTHTHRRRKRREREREGERGGDIRTSTYAYLLKHTH